jgi:hypothetical protein
MSAAGNGTTGVFDELERLDHLLQQGVVGAQAAYGTQAAADPFRGLHLGPAEIEQLLRREPGAPVLSAASAAGGPQREPLTSLAAHHGLSAFEADALLVALAPDIDLRYERLYAYLQDDVTMKRPTVDLILNLLCSSADEKLARRAIFQAEAPLLRESLVRLDGDETTPLLRRVVDVDDQIVRWVLGIGGLDLRLADCCELGPAPAGEPHSGGTDIRLYFRGRAGAGRRAAAEGLAEANGRPLLAVNAERLPDGTARRLMREAALHGALLYVDRTDALAERPREIAALLTEVEGHAGPVVFAGEAAWIAPADAPTVGVHTVTFEPPDAPSRRNLWAALLEQQGAVLAGDEVDALAGRFRFTASQIAAAVADAAATARWRGDDAPGLADLFASARARTGHALGGLAKKVDPVHRLDDIVLPDDALSQLRELCGRVVHRDRVLVEWGFAGKLSLGRGVSALFAGPPGTGKTMAAEIIANELGIDLYRIDLAGVVSKWIGETEKNLDGIFAAAEDANAILFFDEADALFGKRSGVKDSHDRYANVEVSYLLQKMEEYEGVAILATNKLDHLDEAFLRRIGYVVRFPFPEAEERLRIWAGIWPEAIPLGDDLDWRSLAREHLFSGAEIKNVALAAAFLAAETGEPVTMDAVLHAVRREYEKAGRSYQ